MLNPDTSRIPVRAKHFGPRLPIRQVYVINVVEFSGRHPAEVPTPCHRLGFAVKTDATDPEQLVRFDLTQQEGYSFGWTVTSPCIGLVLRQKQS